jgi:two-component system, OmpR family, sensor histidine kinase KdpD
MKHGELRIYVGYAAGVGKTYAMLNEGRRRRERGRDVVVGFVETHGRARTQAQVGDLEVVPRRRIAYRGSTFEEMDVDAVLHRKPEVALVDELAHTNVPGSRNVKRWQDVRELLDAGIDVISTVNIQHLESLNDAIERITGVKQRETIPDDVVRGAEQQELVDMTPFALRRRMAHGNVYPPEKIDAALGNYFREGNLSALRELALLWMADRVDETLRAYMRERGIEGPWEARERILVGLAGLPEDEQLTRRAARMAARRGGELLAVHVVPEDPATSSPRLAASRELVEQVGGRFDEVLGRSVPDALLDIARAENVTQIVLGASDRSRWRELTSGSIVNEVIRGSGPIDVHVISQEAPVAERSLRGRGSRTALPRRRRALGLALAAVVLPVLTVVLAAVHPNLGLPGILLLYLTAVVGIAAVGGLWPAVAAAVASSLIINWFFTPPEHTWTIAEPQNVLGLVVFLLVAVVVSVLVDREARSRSDAQRGRAEAEALARLAARLAAEDDPLPGLVEHLRATFGLDAVAVLHRGEDEAFGTEAAAGPDPPTSLDDVTDAIDLGEHYVLAYRGPRLPADSLRVLSAFAAQLTVAVRGRELASEAAEAASLAEVDTLRTAILAAVSHDLRTPLASIKAAASSLRDTDVAWSPEQTEEFLETIEDEVDRLADLVGNLLDMSRLTTGALTLVRRRVGLDEIVPKALASMSDGSSRVELDVPETLDRVDADPGLLERAVANMASNAVAWSPADRSVSIHGSQTGDRVELRIVDRGPGVPSEDRDRMFEPFQRLGDRSSGDGLGLGLAVARGFIEAMGGDVTVEDTPGGGLTMVLGFEAVR